MDFLQDLIQVSNFKEDKKQMEIEYVINSKYYLIPEYEKQL